MREAEPVWNTTGCREWLFEWWWVAHAYGHRRMLVQVVRDRHVCHMFNVIPPSSIEGKELQVMFVEMEGPLPNTTYHQ